MVWGLGLNSRSSLAEHEDSSLLEDHECGHLSLSPATMPSLHDGMYPQTVSQDKLVCKLLLSGY